MEIIANPLTRSRAAHYVRMSTEHQQYSPENQADILRQYAADHYMEIVQVYSDHGRSGLNIAGRSGLNQLMADVENKQSDFTSLLVYDVSRLIELGFRQGGPAGYGLRRQLIDRDQTPKGLLGRGERKSLQTDRGILIPGPEQ
ncbi:MAG: recombinase family protein [Granulicella sp.]